MLDTPPLLPTKSPMSQRARTPSVATQNAGRSSVATGALLAAATGLRLMPNPTDAAAAGAAAVECGRAVAAAEVAEWPVQRQQQPQQQKPRQQ